MQDHMDLIGVLYGGKEALQMSRWYSLLQDFKSMYIVMPLMG